ncbi:MAG: MBL fold metallo-hydrolase [Methylotenera sp.]|nr:MBL fold metallo-hydrolase [Oligoflexia bacterium]
MKLTILGCGTSTGVPLISCKCSVCRSKNKKNHRLRASVWVQTQGKSLLVDTSPDFRQQALREKISHIDAVLYTHPHADHIHGIDELRSYNYIQKSSIPVYGNDWTCEELRVKFSYIFRPQKVEGGGIPLLELNEFKASQEHLDIAGVAVIPVSLKHGSKECVAYRFGDIAYVTDCSSIPEESLKRLQGLKVLILDCLRLERHGTHFNLDQALENIQVLRPKKTILTHMGHDFDYTKMSKNLPKGVTLAYDGLKVITS